MSKIKKRNYRERSQPHSRQHFGLLEKHKDYLVRAKDYHKKKDYLKRLEEKASFKNPEEFYFKMINSKKKGGIHQVQYENKTYTQKDLVDMKTQDINYINFKLSQEDKKVKKIQSQLHLLQPSTEEEINKSHTIFVDNEEEVDNFDPEKEFNTPRELITRTFNRPTFDNLKNDNFLLMEQNLSAKELKKMDNDRNKKYNELYERMEREQELKETSAKLHIQKRLMGKGTVFKTRKQGKSKPPVYRYKKERKK